MAQFKIYQSSDSGAPQLSGISGSLIRVLDACLINGYGAMSGAGWFRRYATADLTSGNSGTQAVYQSPSGSSSQFYLYVGDNHPNGTSLGKEAAWCMSETVTGLSGVVLTQLGYNVLGLATRKSTTNDATARPWICFVDDRTLHFFVRTGDNNASYYLHSFYGDFYSYLPNDKYNVWIGARNYWNSASITYEASELVSWTSYTLTSNPAGYSIRNMYGLGTATMLTRMPMYSVLVFYTPSNQYLANLAGYENNAGVLPFPNPPDGGLYLSPCLLVDPYTPPARQLRGKMRGIYYIGNTHSQIPMNDREIFNGTAELVGRQFMLIKYNGYGACFAVEISNTLDTN